VPWKRVLLALKAAAQNVLFTYLLTVRRELADITKRGNRKIKERSQAVGLSVPRAVRSSAFVLRGTPNRLQWNLQSREITPTLRH